MATPTPDPSSNANILGQAQNSDGTLSSTPATPITDISQLPLTYGMYASGGGAPSGPKYVAGKANASAGDSGQEQTIPASQWMMQFYSSIANNPTALQQFATEAQLANLVGASANIPQLYSAWQKLIVEAYNYNISGQQMTPWDVLANSIPGVAAGTYKNNNGYSYVTGMTSAQAQQIAAKAAATATNKQTTSSEIDINYTDPDTARYVLNQASEQLLGRQATDAEVASFTKNLNADEANFPKMTQDIKSTEGSTLATTSPTATSDLGTTGQTVVGYDSEGNPIFGPTTADTTSTNSTGNTTDTVVSLGEQDYTRYGREQLAEDAAKSSPDYGAYQAAGPLMQAFLGTLKSAVSGVGSNS